jgi:hypothetical protein
MIGQPSRTTHSEGNFTRGLACRAQ